MEKLPLTSYPKMIDFWLIFCQLVPFAEVIFRFKHHHLIQVILLTAMENMREETDKKSQARRPRLRGRKRGKTVNWACQIKTFGEESIQINSRKMLPDDIFCFREEGFAWSRPFCWIDLLLRCCCLLFWLNKCFRCFDLLVLQCLNFLFFWCSMSRAGNKQPFCKMYIWTNPHSLNFDKIEQRYDARNLKMQQLQKLQVQ